MFSLKRRWIWANQTGLSKAKGRKKGQKRFWPVAAAAGQNLAGCSRPLSLLPCARSRARAHCCAHSALHLSTTLLCTAEGEGERGCCSQFTTLSRNIPA